MEALASFGIETKMLVWQIINFGILFAALWYLLYKPLRKIMRERERKVSESLTAAKKLETKSAKLDKEFHEKMMAQRKELEEMHQKLLEQQEKLRKEMKAKAEAETLKIVEESRGLIAQEKAQMLQELENEVKQLAVALASKIIDKKMDDAVEESIVKEALASLRKET